MADPDSVLRPISLCMIFKAIKHENQSSVAGDATPMSRSGRKEDKSSREDGDLKTPGKKSTSLRAQSSGEHPVSTPEASTSRQSTLTSTGRRQKLTPVSSFRRTTTYVQTTLPFTNSKSVAETPRISPIRGDPSGNFGDSLGSREWSPALQSPHISPVRSGQTSKSRRDPSPPPKTKTPLAEPATPSRSSQRASGSQSLLSKMSALQAKQKQAARKVKKPRKRTKNPKEHIPLSTIKSIFRHFTNRPVSADAFSEVERLSAIFWEHLAEDLEAYALHRHKKKIDESDVRLLMRRQRFVTDDYSFNAAVENLLPMELRRQLIPIARSGNRIEL